MSRRLLILFALLALVVGALAPAAAGAAQEDGAAALSSKVVAESTSGSYIVVMAADPLVVDFGQDKLNTKAAKAKGKAMAKGHDKALTSAGVSADAKVQSFTNALNGFSAVISHADATKLAARDDVERLLLSAVTIAYHC